MIEVLQVTKDYKIGWLGRRTIRALHNISLTVHPGEIFGLLGPNGAGKTTLVKLICGLLRPNAGRILLQGHDLQRERGPCMRLIGAVLEGNRNFYWSLTPWENLVYYARLREAYHPRETPKRAQELLQLLELTGKRDAVGGTLSRGMQQKLALCCALIGDPPILLLDEPLLGVDVESAQRIKAFLRRLARERGKAILLTTHNLRLVEEVCDRVGILREGRLIWMGTVAELKRLFPSWMYEIRCVGPLPQGIIKALSRLPNVSCRSAPTESVIRIHSRDRFSRIVYSILRLLEEEKIPLIPVARKEPDLEEIFLKLIREGSDEALSQPLLG